MSGPASPLRDVRSFWNTEACGTHFVPEFSDEVDFYKKFREFRYRTEWHLLELVPFDKAASKRVLEIGLGNGADGTMFAANGADYTGVDITETAVAATRRHFEVLGLAGRFRVENAEQLGIDDASFDMVYSHGVLHHTPNTQRAIDEVWRVLKPGGEAIVMLYHKHSFNYYVRIMTFMRLRLLAKIFSRVGRWSNDRRKLKAEGFRGVRGNADRAVWQLHYEHFLHEGWSYLRARSFVHHCTDGPECPIAHAFSTSEARKLFSKFENVRTAVAHLPLRKYSRWFPFAWEKFVARRLGWYLFIYATKPQPGAC